MKISQTLLPRLLAGTFVIGGLSFGSVGHSPAMLHSAAAAEVAAPNFAPVLENAPFAKQINNYLKADQQQMPPQDAVLFAGSSTTVLWSSLAQDFPEIPVINRGFGGSQIFQNTLYADRVAIRYRPKIIVLFAGTNDLASGKAPQRVFEDFKAYVAKIHAALPATRIVYLSITPTVARWKSEAKVLETNYLIQKWIFENNSPTKKLNFINTHAPLLSADGQPQPALLRPDGLHLNAEGYKVYASIIKPRVLALAALDGVKRLDVTAESAKTK